MLKRTVLLITVIVCISHTNYAQQLAFPGAEGFGQYASGGREGLVYVVTNLNDDGEGSLRKGILKSEPRTIVFAVSGTIDLKSNLDINHGNLTIAGQTAPGDGICIKNYPMKVKADNIIIQYMRFRMGDEDKVEDDAFGGRDQQNIILDHCSISWATDENASFYWNKNFTMQWCIISEALNNSIHHKGAHGYGGIWGGENASFHHNLIASNKSRNPRFGGSQTVPNPPNEFVDFRNNVIFNWGDNSIYGGEKGKYNVVNNYFKPGQATTSSKKERIVNPYEPYGKFYVNGNVMLGSEKVTEDNWNGGVQCENPEATKLANPLPVSNINTETAENAFTSVLLGAGASLHRDVVDKRIVESVKNGQTTFKNGIIDSQNDVGGWPELKSKTPLKDSDQDGIPDNWEEKKNLNPQENDAIGFDLSQNYTNLEVYIQSLTSSPKYSAVIDGETYYYVVAQDGSGNFNSVQEVIQALPDFRKKETKVYLKNGVYKEKLVLPTSKTNITFIGESKDKTILTYDDYAQKKNEFGEEIGTTGSSSFFIFGNGFKAENITFENSAGSIGQAVAVRVDGDEVVFINCNFLGNQDTLYLHGKDSRQYYKDCYIEGTVDFIFGWSTAVFENCEIFSKSDGYVTAASTEKGATYGMTFIDCDFTGKAEKNSVYLGRPWRDYAQTVLINCKLGNHIKPEGWHNWDKPNAEQTTFYAEYGSTGPGASTSRVGWAKILTAQQASKFTVDKILQFHEVPKL